MLPQSYLGPGSGILVSTLDLGTMTLERLVCSTRQFWHVGSSGRTNLKVLDKSMRFHLVCQELRSINQEINRLRQQLHRAQQRVSPYFLTQRHRAIAVAIFVLDGNGADAAAEYCSQIKPGPPQDWKGVVEDWYLQCSIDQLLAYQTPELHRDVQIHTAASRWLAERTTARWVQDQNYHQGVAPASSAMATQYVTLLGSHLAGAVATNERAARRFCQNLRSRWPIRVGVLKVREAMPEDVIRQKAPLVSGVLQSLGELSRYVAAASQH